MYETSIYKWTSSWWFHSPWEHMNELRLFSQNRVEDETYSMCNHEIESAKYPMIFHGDVPMPGAPSVSDPLGPAPASSAVETSAEGEALDSQTSAELLDLGWTV